MSVSASTEKMLRTRDQAIWQARKSGLKLSDVGKQFGVSLERVRQIIKDYDRRAIRSEETKDILKIIQLGGYLSDETNVSELPLSVRTANCLRNFDITTVGQARSLTRKEYLQTPNFAKKSLKELEQMIGSLDKNTMRVTSDTEANAAYISLVAIGPGEACSQVWTGNGNVVLDFNAAGQLIGVELLDLALLHPDLARDAVQIEAKASGA